MTGPHGLEQCASTTSRILDAVYSECKVQGVNLRGTILKPNSVPQIILIIAEYQHKAAFVADQEINTVACLTEIMAEAEWT